MTGKAPRVERYSKQEWLELAKQTGLQYEYLDGYVYAMAGESDDHNDIVGNIVEVVRSANGKRPVGPSPKSSTTASLNSPVLVKN